MTHHHRLLHEYDVFWGCGSVDVCTDIQITLLAGGIKDRQVGRRIGAGEDASQHTFFA